MNALTEQLTRMAIKIGIEVPQGGEVFLFTHAHAPHLGIRQDQNCRLVRWLAFAEDLALWGAFDLVESGQDENKAVLTARKLLQQMRKRMREQSKTA